MTSGEELLVRTKEYARRYQTGVHVHLAEEHSEVDFCLREHGKRPAEYLDSIGFLAPNVPAAHCAFLSDGEVATLGDRGSRLPTAR